MMTALKFMPVKQKLKLPWCGELTIDKTTTYRPRILSALVTIVTVLLQTIHRFAMFPVIARTFASRPSSASTLPRK